MPFKWDENNKSANLSVSGTSDEIVTYTGATGIRSLIQAVLHTVSRRIYWELLLTSLHPVSGYLIGFGVGQQISNFTALLGSTATQFGWCTFGNATDMRLFSNFLWGGTNYGAYPSNGTRLRCAYDGSAGKFWIGNTSGWFNGGNPETGANPTFAGISGSIYPMISLFTAGDQVAGYADPANCVLGLPAGFEYASPYLSGRILIKEGDPDSSAAIDLLVTNRATGASVAKTTTNTDGTFSLQVDDMTIEYDVVAIHPAGTYPPIVVAERVKGV